MATVTTAITPAQKVFTYSDVTPANVDGIPHREIRAVSIANSIAAPGAGNNQHFTITVTLPAQFGYRILEAWLAIHSGTVTQLNWRQQVYAELAGATGATRSLIPLNFHYPAAEVGGGGNAVDQLRDASGTPFANMSYELESVPSMIVLPETPSDQVRFFVEAYNPTANDILVLVDFQARFLQYDLQAANLARANVPNVVTKP